tara:strand:+ start:1627 stop:2256 length:630 start_codon:yes stop_codon:yes gene_type:complete
LKNLILFFLFFFINFSYGQLISIDYGLKAGINFNSQLNITADIESIDNKINIFESRNGQHFGIFLKLKIKDFYLKPEFNFTQIKNSYDIPYILVQTKNVITNFDQKKFDIPVMIGYKFFKNLNIFVGPRFEYIKKVNFDNFNIDDLKNDYRIGLQYGFGVKFLRFEIDIRAERGFKKNEINYMKNSIGNKNQFITSSGKLYLLALSFYL